MSLKSDFIDRKTEVMNFICFLEKIEKALQSGSPLLSTGNGDENYRIDPAQQKTLYSCLYLQLYNLVESSIIKCIEFVESHLNALNNTHWNLLSNDVKKELLRTMLKKQAILTPKKRTEEMLAFLNALFAQNENLNVSIDRGAGGNWDDEYIFKLAKRIGLSLGIPEVILKEIKQKQYDDMGMLGLIRHFRNKLAHGELSFVDCGERLTFSELKKLTETVCLYLEFVIDNFQQFVEQRLFMQTIN